MLTNQDIQKLTAVLAGKKDVEELREEVVALRESVQGLTTAIDGLAKAIEDFREENAVVKLQLSRHEKWIRQIARRAGVKLEV